MVNGLRAVLIEQLFFQFFLFLSFQEKQEKQEKQENISRVWKFDTGQNIWKASHSNIWGKKKENMEIQKIAQNIYMEI